MEGPRAVTVDELPLVEELVNSVFRVPEGLPPVLFSMLPRVYAPTNTARVRAVFDGGLPVAVASYLLDWIVMDGCEILTASLSTVATRTDYRNQGLSSLILDESLSLMRREGARILFVSGDRDLYRRLGCYPAGIAWTARLGLNDLPPSGLAALRQANGQEEAPLLQSLHRMEDPRFMRDEEQMRQMLLAESFARAFGYESHIWVAVHEGQPVAYVIVAVSQASPAEGRIIEYAGDRRALAGMLRTLLRRMGLESVEVSVPNGDRFFLDRLRMAGGTWQARTMPGTINLLDPIGLWQDLMPSLVRRMGEGNARRLTVTAGEGGAISITVGQEALFLQDRERLLGLIFGAGDRPWLDRALPGTLQRSLSACLPLPLPWLQGLNYV